MKGPLHKTSQEIYYLIVTTSWHEVHMDNSPTWKAGGICHCHEWLNKWIAANKEHLFKENY